jgi:5-formyltetrahydrofolate cyclo-ligase
VPTLADKAAWRTRLIAARRTLPAEVMAAAATALRHHLVPRMAGLARVAAYVPVGPEPGSLDLLDDLRRGGTSVLLPVVMDNGMLDWAGYSGRDELIAGRLGLREPAGRRLGRHALRDADAVLVPALAADHRGTRLGRGGGYYDRALADLEPGRPVVALLHDGELVPRLPADPWDTLLTAAASPAQGWTELPLVPHHGISSHP